MSGWWLSHRQPNINVAKHPQNLSYVETQQMTSRSKNQQWLCDVIGIANVQTKHKILIAKWETESNGSVSIIIYASKNQIFETRNTNKIGLFTFPLK